MAKNKFDFIAELLEQNKITVQQRERILSLAVLEIRNEERKDEDILKRISDIEEMLKIKSFEEPITINLNLDNLKDNQRKRLANNEQKDRVIIHKPKDVANFMYLFNKRDGFKYLTHDFDGEGIFEIDTFLKNAKDLFDLETKKLSIPKDLYAIVYQFAFSDKPVWGSFIKEGFSTQKWIRWSNENKLSPLRNKEFEKIINKFRTLTRIESPYLENIVEELIKETFENSNFEINLKRLDKADFYTNTTTFKTAIKSIFQVIYKKRKNEKENNKLTIEYKGFLVSSYYEVNLMISHFNSFPTKDFKQLLEEWRGDKGAIGEIKAKLFGYCDWSIETKLEGVCYRINLLKEDSAPDYEVIPSETVEGTKHILKFYYKTSD